MARKFGLRFGGEEAYELVQHTRSGSHAFSRIESTASTLVQSARPLLAKSLTRRRIKRLITVVVITILFLIVCFAFLFFIAGAGVPSGEGVTIGNDDTCDLETLNGSSVQSAFTINFRTPSRLTFAEAKTIDVIWDLVVGQGGRFFLGWISYKVFMDGLVRVMEKSAVSYELYASMAFEPMCVMSIWSSLKALFMIKGWRSKVFLAWFSISTLYVLAFSTLISAGSGYVTPSTAGFTMTDGSFVTASSDSLTRCFDLTDGALIGLSNGTIVPGPPSHVVHEATVISSDYSANYDRLKPVSSELFYTLYTYPAGRRIYTKTNTSESDQPAMWRGYTTNIIIDGHRYIFENYTFNPIPIYCYNNQSLPDDLTPIAKCLPEPYFVWGWSSLLAYITLGLQLAWIVGMFGVWLDANINSQLCRKGRNVRGYFRAAADISEAMSENLGDEYCAYSNSEIAQELRKERNGLRYYTSNEKDSDVSHIGISSNKLERLDLRDDAVYGAYTTSRA